MTSTRRLCPFLTFDPAGHRILSRHRTREAADAAAARNGAVVMIEIHAGNYQVHLNEQGIPVPFVANPAAERRRQRRARRLDQLTIAFPRESNGQP